MTLIAPGILRPAPITPWWADVPAPRDDDIQAEADTAWAVARGLVGDDPWMEVDAESSPWEPLSGRLEPDVDAAASDAATTGVDASLARMESAAAERHRATAEEYRLIASIVSDAVIDPDPWVGPDPTLDGAWTDPRRRRVSTIRRDRLDMAERAAVAEIALRLRVSEPAVRARAMHARTLQERCPRLWSAFTAGRISERHAVEAARLAASLPDDGAGWELFDDGAAPRALRLTPAKFAASARALRERVHAESLEERHRRAASDRGVWITPELDGMASLTAFLPADRARGLLARLDRLARHLRAAPDEQRTLAQLRADVLGDLALAPSAQAPDGRPSRNAPRSGPPAPVVVTVPALTLLGVGDEPATLEGYGPIDLDTARRLAGEATSWVRLLTHPMTGAPLVLDRSTYRVPAALRRWLGVTSPTCVFPGCSRAARDCDLDHLTAWADGGTTDDDNLEPECPHHHRLRHESAWMPSRAPDTGELRWTSPRGVIHDVDPPPF